MPTWLPSARIWQASGSQATNLLKASPPKMPATPHGSMCASMPSSCVMRTISRMVSMP